MALLDYMNLNNDQSGFVDPVQQNTLMNLQNSVQSSPPQIEQQPSSMSWLDKGVKLFTDPAFISSLNATSSALGNDGAGYQQWTNAYTQRLAEREQQARLERLEKAKTGVYARNQEVAALYDAYTPESVNEFRSTGDYTVLKPNKKYELQELRANQGDIRLQQGDVRLQQQEKGVGISQQNANTSTFTALSNDEIKRRQLELDRQASGFDGILLGDGETIVRGPGRIQGKDGVYYDVSRGPSGLSAKAVSLADQQKYEATSAGPSQASTQSQSDIQMLLNGIDNGRVDSFTGQVVGRNPILQDVASSTFASQEERDLYQSAKRLQGQLSNLSIQTAREMGASGINSESEFERFARSMPQLDFTSPTALRSSLAAVSSVINSYAAPKSISTTKNVNDTSTSDNTTTQTVTQGSPVGTKLRSGNRIAVKIKEGSDTDKTTWQIQ